MVGVRSGRADLHAHDCAMSCEGDGDRFRQGAPRGCGCPDLWRDYMVLGESPWHGFIAAVDFDDDVAEACGGTPGPAGQCGGRPRAFFAMPWVRGYDCVWSLLGGGRGTWWVGRATDAAACSLGCGRRYVHHVRKGKSKRSRSKIGTKNRNKHNLPCTARQNPTPLPSNASRCRPAGRASSDHRRAAPFGMAAAR